MTDAASAANVYHFITHWRVSGRVEEVSAIIQDFHALPRWWPSVYLRVEELEQGDARGVGRRVALLTKGWLPYTLRWEARTIESRAPFGFSLVASGDFRGRGIWTFTQDGPEVDVTFDWALRAEKPLIRTLSPVLKPIFAANHRWAMARGEESLRLELARRRAMTAARAALVPAPPGPTSTAALVAGAAGITLAAILAVRFSPAGRVGRARRNKSPRRDPPGSRARTHAPRGSGSPASRYR